MNSPLAYIGGKSRLSKVIIEMIPVHKTYVEVFAGACWVFFRKDISKYEVVNDLDSELIAFYRVLQNHLEEFLKQFKWLLSSRELFNDFKKQQEAGGLTDIQKACRYYYLQRHAFSGRVKNRTYGVGVDRHPNINLLRMEEELSAVHLRFARVKIENQPWQNILKIYDRPETFFYLDPPYFKAPYYNHNLKGVEDFEEIAGRLSELDGKFILSINNTPEMLEAFKRFKIRKVKLNYSVAKTQNTVGRELLITNI